MYKQTDIENLDQMNEQQLRELIREERDHSRAIIKMFNEQSFIMGALRQAFETSIIVDMRDYSFKLLTATPEVRYASSKVSSVLQLATLFCQNYVDPEYAAGFMDFVNEGTISERLAGNRYISYEYMTKNIGLCHARFVPAEIDSKGRIIKAIFTTEILHDQHSELSVLRVAALQDALTGIANRYSGEKKIKEQLSQGNDFVYALLDCDSFKNINDTFGHPTGDTVLIEVAKALSDVFGHENVMRLGGDEFVAFTNNPEVTENVRQNKFSFIFKKLHERLKQIDIPMLKGKYPTLSCGAVLVHDASQHDLASVYAAADQNLYKVKSSHNGEFLYTEL